MENFKILSMKKIDRCYTAKKQALSSILEQYISIPKSIYGDCLEKVILFGSYARGDFRSDSDIDIMLLLDIQPHKERECAKRLLDDTFDFNMENNIDIQPIPKSINTFQKWGNILPFYKEINKEGVVLYDK